MRIPLAVLDTNVLVSGLILPKSKPARILSLWRSRKIHIVISATMLRELEAVLQYPKLLKKYALDTIDVTGLIHTIQKGSMYLQVIHKPDVSLRDPKDLIILGSALSGNADYLVTGDKDLLAVKQRKSIGKLLIVTPAQFLEHIAL